MPCVSILRLRDEPGRLAPRRAGEPGAIQNLADSPAPNYSRSVLECAQSSAAFHAPACTYRVSRGQSRLVG